MRSFLARSLRHQGKAHAAPWDVLAIGRALKAWPLPLLHVVDFYDFYDEYDDDELSDEEEHADAEEKMRLSTCWRALSSRQRAPMRTGPTR